MVPEKVNPATSKVASVEVKENPLMSHKSIWLYPSFSNEKPSITL